MSTHVPRDVAPDEFYLRNPTANDSPQPSMTPTVSRRAASLPDASPRMDESVLLSGIVDLTEVDFGDAMRLADVDLRTCRLQLLEAARNPGLAAVQGTRDEPPRVARMAEQRHARP